MFLLLLLLLLLFECVLCRCSQCVGLYFAECESVVGQQQQIQVYRLLLLLLLMMIFVCFVFVLVENWVYISVINVLVCLV